MANPEEKLHAPFVAQLRTAGLLNLDDVTDRMLRILVELAVNHCLQVGTRCASSHVVTWASAFSALSMWWEHACCGFGELGVWRKAWHAELIAMCACLLLRKLLTSLWLGGMPVAVCGH
eukprot:GHRQ01034873.1.p4 GENE.GHRQ01034873.1~~GHRQ01034873.1.p4  ORF type:complete len:119 (-),score=35.81 GHRQ01034873.1:8-364(-)